MANDLNDRSRPHPDHHLWRNGRLWWIAFTVHHGHRQKRIRRSLGTADVVEARQRRDSILAAFDGEGPWVLSLRISARRLVEDADHAQRVAQ